MGDALGSDDAPEIRDDVRDCEIRPPSERSSSRRSRARAGSRRRRPDMKHRQRDQDPGASVQIDREHRADRGRDDIPVAERNNLGRAGRAAGWCSSRRDDPTRVRNALALSRSSEGASVSSSNATRPSRGSTTTRLRLGASSCSPSDFSYRPPGEPWRRRGTGFWLSPR